MSDEPDYGRVATQPGSREPSPSSTGLGPSGFDPSRIAEKCEQEATESTQHYVLVEALDWKARNGGGDECWRTGIRLLNVGAYLDAAMSLVPEGWRMRDLCDWHDIDDDGGWSVDLITPDDSRRVAQGNALTAPLAICAAALKAQSL